MSIPTETIQRTQNKIFVLGSKIIFSLSDGTLCSKSFSNMLLIFSISLFSFTSQILCITPLSSSKHLLATAEINSKSWLIVITIFFFFISFISPTTISKLFLSIPDVGSSKITTLLSERYAIIKVNFCICPPERENGCLSLYFHISNRLSKASISSYLFRFTPYLSSDNTEFVKN